MRVDRPATSEEVAAIMAAVAAMLAEEAATAPVETPLDPWHVAARVEALGIVRRIPGKLDLSIVGAIHGLTRKAERAKGGAR